MDWAKAIEINQQALIRIIAALFAMLGLENGGAVERLPQAFHSAVLRILRPAESAVRRLIIIAARGLVLELAVVRPMPKGIARTGKSTARIAFQLFDSRKCFSFAPRKQSVFKVPPRIYRYFDEPALVPSYFRPQAEYVVPVEAPIPTPVPAPESGVNALHLCRRLAAVKLALDDLPRQAKRLLRWQARRDKLERPKFTDPLRPGPPPGHRKKPSEDIDFVLKECHALARHLPAANTS